MDRYVNYRYRVTDLYVEKNDEDTHTLFASHMYYEEDVNCVTFNISHTTVEFEAHPGKPNCGKPAPREGQAGRRWVADRPVVAPNRLTPRRAKGPEFKGNDQRRDKQEIGRCLGTPRSVEQIDQWVRSRLLYCIWAHWKRVSTRYKALRKLGASHRNVYIWVNTRKSGWHTAHSFVLTGTITNTRLRKKGYTSLLELYLDQS